MIILKRAIWRLMPYDWFDKDYVRVNKKLATRYRLLGWEIIVT